MIKRLFKTMVAVLAIAATAIGPAWGQSNHTKYTSAVAMSALQVDDTLAEGFSLTGNESNFIYFVANRHKHNENLSGYLENISLDQVQSIGANCVFSTLVNEQSITFAPVDENGRDGVAWVVTEVESIEDFTNITIAGIRIPGPPHTVRFASGNDGWSVKAVSATTHEASAVVTAPDILENVFAGDSLVVTAPDALPGKVKSVKAKVKKRPEFVPGATIQNLESFVEVENNRDGTITLHMPTLNPSTYNVTNSSYLSNGEHTLHYGYELGSGTDMSAIGTDFNTRSGWSDHTPFSELDKTIDITSGKPRVAILITGHVQSATCPAPGKEHYWGLYRYTNPVKVTYNLGGGSVSGSTADKVEYLFSGDALATTFAAPTREGFTFDGWYTSAEGGTKLTASNATSATTIYAHWNAIDE